MRQFKCIINSRKSPLSLPYWVTVGEVYDVEEVVGGGIRVTNPLNNCRYWLDSEFFEEIF